MVYLETITGFQHLEFTMHLILHRVKDIFLCLIFWSCAIECKNSLHGFDKHRLRIFSLDASSCHSCIFQISIPIELHSDQEQHIIKLTWQCLLIHETAGDIIPCNHSEELHELCQAPKTTGSSQTCWSSGYGSSVCSCPCRFI
jgi:hypothetical protein